MFNTVMTAVLGVFGPKARLIIEYVLIGLLLASLGMTVALYIGKLKQEQTVSNLTNQVQVLDGQVAGLENLNTLREQDIQELKQLRFLDADVLGKLVNEMTAISNRDHEFRAALGRLEASDESVRSYLNSPVPPQLRCMLERTCEDPGSAGMPQARARTVQPTGKVPSPSS